LSSFFPVPFSLFDLVFYCLFSFFYLVFYHPFFFPFFFTLVLYMFFSYVVLSLGYPNLLGNKRLGCCCTADQSMKSRDLSVDHVNMHVTRCQVSSIGIPLEFASSGFCASLMVARFREGCRQGRMLEGGNGRCAGQQRHRHPQDVGDGGPVQGGASPANNLAQWGAGIGGSSSGMPQETAAG
jgi:hypothetical protein